MEGYEASTYREHIASVYDTWCEERLDPTSAIDFLAPFATGGRALEIGFGTGPVPIPLKQRGIDVHGLRVRHCWPSEHDLMTRLAGLALEQRFAWYDRSPFEPSSKRHVSVYAHGGQSAEEEAAR